MLVYLIEGKLVSIFNTLRGSGSFFLAIANSGVSDSENPSDNPREEVRVPTAS